MTLQPGERLVEFSQVSILARAGEMEEKGVVQLRTVKADPQGFDRLPFKQSLFYLPITIESRMASHDSSPLRGYLYTGKIQAVVFPPPDSDHEVQSDPTRRMKNDLIRLPGLHPGYIPADHGCVDIGLQVALGDSPPGRQGKNHEVPGSEKNVIGGDDLFFPFGGHEGLAGSEILRLHLFIQEDVEPCFIFSCVFLPAVDDESGVSENPVTDGFDHPLEGLGIDDFDENFLPVLLGQLLYPEGEKEIVFLQVLRVLIEILMVLLFLQTDLVCHEFALGSCGQETGDQGYDFDSDRLYHNRIIGRRGRQINTDFSASH
jgi:hypothetical protein